MLFNVYRPRKSSVSIELFSTVAITTKKHIRKGQKWLPESRGSMRSILHHLNVYLDVHILL